MKTNTQDQILCEDCGAVADVLDPTYDEGYCTRCATKYGDQDWDTTPVPLEDGRP